MSDVWVNCIHIEKMSEKQVSTIYRRFIDGLYDEITLINMFDGTSFTVPAGSVIQPTIIAIAEDGNQQQGGADTFTISISPDSTYLASIIDSKAIHNASADGEYSFRFMAKRALSSGYQLSVTINGNHIKGSPFPVSVNPGSPSAAQSNIYSGNYGYDTSLGEFGSVAGVGRKFLLQLRDEYGNDLDQVAASPSGNKLSIKIDGATNVSTSIMGMPDGRFEMFYSVNLAQTYNLQAQLEGVAVGGGSSIVVVAGDNDYSQFHVYGPGITSDVIGRSSKEDSVQNGHHDDYDPRDDHFPGPAPGVLQ